MFGHYEELYLSNYCMEVYSHPILDGINDFYFHPNVDDECHPILGDVNNC